MNVHDRILWYMPVYGVIRRYMGYMNVYEGVLVYEGIWGYMGVSSATLSPSLSTSQLEVGNLRQRVASLPVYERAWIGHVWEGKRLWAWGRVFSI